MTIWRNIITLCRRGPSNSGPTAPKSARSLIHSERSRLTRGTGYVRTDGRAGVPSQRCRSPPRPYTTLHSCPRTTLEPGLHSAVATRLRHPWAWGRHMSYDRQTAAQQPAVHRPRDRRDVLSCLGAVREAGTQRELTTSRCRRRQPSRPPCLT